jgi:hypothetical protein
MRHSAQWLTRAAILLALALGIQSLRLPQGVTGPSINAILLIGAVLLAPWGGVVIGLLTPLTAFLFGQLNPILAPAVPFIMAGNGILVLVFGYGRRVNVYLALIIAALAKYLVLSTAVRYLIKVPASVGIALQIPQFVTAFMGGVAALLVLEGLAAAGIVTRGQWAVLWPRPRR